MSLASQRIVLDVERRVFAAVAWGGREHDSAEPGELIEAFANRCCQPLAHFDIYCLGGPPLLPTT